MRCRTGRRSILGLVQGATELLPISSSGHLILVPWLADWKYLKEHDAFNQTFDVSLHLGHARRRRRLLPATTSSRLAACVARQLRRRAIETADERIAWFVAAATIPAAIVGAVGENLIAENLGEPWQIAILLARLRRRSSTSPTGSPERKDMSQVGLQAAVGVGLAQTLALMPGVSRSGITITAGRFLGLDRDSAARFSFLLLVPITFGAVLYKGVTDVVLADLPPGMRGRSSSARSRRSRARCVAISRCSATCAATTTRSSSSTGWSLAAIVLLLIATGARAAGF